MRKYKKTILVDMDGVLVKEPSKEHEELMRIKSNMDGPEFENVHWSDVPNIFLDLEPMEGAINAYNELSKRFSLYIVSTPPWENPSGWSDKKQWVEKYLPIAKKRLFLTHNKHMVKGDYIIDDRLKNGVEYFPETVVQFGTEPFQNWEKVLNYFENIDNIV